MNPASAGFSRSSALKFPQAVHEALEMCWTYERHWDSDLFIFRSTKLKDTWHIQTKGHTKLYQRIQIFLKVSLCLLLVWGHLCLLGL